MSQSIPGREPASDTWGFTLIEVIAALLIFASGVLLLLEVSDNISQQMEYAAISSEMVSEAEQHLDSLSATAYVDLALGETTDTLSVRGVVYDRTVIVTQYSPLLRQIDLTMVPRTADAPSHSAHLWVADRW